MFAETGSKICLALMGVDGGRLRGDCPEARTAAVELSAKRPYSGVKGTGVSDGHV